MKISMFGGSGFGFNNIAGHEKAQNAKKFTESNAKRKRLRGQGN